MTNPVLYYPFDPEGINQINLINDEFHKLNAARGIDHAFLKIRKAPFHKKDFSIQDKKTGRFLKEDLDYRFAVPYVNEGLVSNCFFIVEILNKEYFDSVLLPLYRTLGGNNVFDELEIMEYLARSEINPRNISWSEVKNKPGRYVVEPHIQHIKDFFGFDDLYEYLDNHLQTVRTKQQALVQRLSEHMLEVNAHKIEPVDLNLHLLKNLRPVEAGDFEKPVLNAGEKKRFVTSLELNKYLEANFMPLDELLAISLDGPKQVRRSSSFKWRISNYDSFSNYTVTSDRGTFSVFEDYVHVEFYSTDALGDVTFTVSDGSIATSFTVELLAAGVVVPAILGISDSEIDVSLSPTFSTQSFRTEPVNKDTLIKVIYQISREPNFNDLVFLGEGNSSSQQLTATLGKDTQYYIRAKHIGSIYESPWTEAVSFRTKDIAVNKPKHTEHSVSVGNGAHGHNFVVNPDIAPTYLTQQLITAVEYQLRRIVNNSVERPVVAESGTKEIQYFNLLPTLQWCPLANSDNSVHGLYGAGGYNKSPVAFQELKEYEVISRVRIAEQWSDWSEPLIVKMSNVSYDTIQEPIVVGEGDSAYTEYRDKQIQTYS